MSVALQANASSQPSASSCIPGECPPVCDQRHLLLRGRQLSVSRQPFLACLWCQNSFLVVSRHHAKIHVTAEVRCSRPHLQAALELQPGSTSASADERSIASSRGSIGRASNSSPILALSSEFSSDGSSRGSLAAEEAGSSSGTSSSKQHVCPLSLLRLC